MDLNREERSNLKSGAVREGGIMKVYEIFEENCGTKLIFESMEVVLEAAELFMRESVDGFFRIEIIEMSKEQLDKLPETDGC
jgi:hypothetical protein